MRSWVLERLEQEASGESLVAVVRKAVLDELVEIWSTTSTYQGPPSAATETSTARSISS